MSAVGAVGAVSAVRGSADRAVARLAVRLVRRGAPQAVVTASFDTPHADGPVAELLAGNGLDIDPGEPLIVRRIVKADGGSRGFVNDQPASAGLLRDLAQHLVEVHGQHDDRGLLAPAGHRALLDAFGRCRVGGVAAAHRAWRDAEAALAGAPHTPQVCGPHRDPHDRQSGPRHKGKRPADDSGQRRGQQRCDKRPGIEGGHVGGGHWSHHRR